MVATWNTHRVCEVEQAAFGCVGLDWSEHVRVDEALVRGKAELHGLVGDPSKAARAPGWEPTVDFEGLVRLLVDADLERLRATSEPAMLADF